MILLKQLTNYHLDIDIIPVLDGPDLVHLLPYSHLEVHLGLLLQFACSFSLCQGPGVQYVRSPSALRSFQRAGGCTRAKRPLRFMNLCLATVIITSAITNGWPSDWTRR